MSGYLSATTLDYVKNLTVAKLHGIVARYMNWCGYLEQTYIYAK